MTNDDVAELEGWADELRSESGVFDDVPKMSAICEGVTKKKPVWGHIPTEGSLVDDQATLRFGLPEERARWVLAHEVGHVPHKRRRYCLPDEEERCDLLGAMLCCPRDAYRRAIRWHSHRVHELARVFKTTQSLALLRLGEVTGRPVLLLRPKGPIARGDAYEWPLMSTLARSLSEGRGRVHPIPIRDEPDRIGLMVERAVWASLVA